MTAQGGVVPIDSARERPVSLLDSGPVGGTLGSRFVGAGYQEPNIICTDVGGTSFDVSLVIDGDVQLEHEPVIAQYTFKVPKVAVKSIGAGGGSIAWVDDIGVLKVGPRSAGAQPGPACYGRGGTLPTVTDANLVLGYLNPDNFLGGTMRLDRDAAVAALAPSPSNSVDRQGDGRGGAPDHELAHGRLLPCVNDRARLRPREFGLFAYGGAGGEPRRRLLRRGGCQRDPRARGRNRVQRARHAQRILVHLFDRRGRSAPRSTRPRSTPSGRSSTSSRRPPRRNWRARASPSRPRASGAAC